MSLWGLAMKAGGAFGLRHRGRSLQTWHLIHMEDKSLNLSLWYAVTSPLPFRFLFFISIVILNLFSLPLLPWLWKTFQTQPHWSCMCSLKFGVLWLFWSKRWRLLKNSETLQGTMDSYHLFMRPDSGLKPHTHPQEAGTTFSSLCCSSLPSTWPVPGNYPVPLDLSPALLS